VKEGERLERSAVAAEATDAIVATLSARLDALLASWQRAVQAEAKATPKTENVKPRPARDVLTDLQRQINELDLRIDTLRREVDSENQQAENWEQRAMIALRDNREDLAKQALHEQQLHANAAASKESEVIELEAVRGAYQSAVAAVQASLDR
jgi:phage shock protein A